MKKWLRRVRGAIGMGLTWAVAWFPVGAIIGLVAGLTDTPGSLVTLVFVLASTFAAVGFVGGTIFSTILGLAEGRRRFDQMSLPRFAAWGALGAFLVAALVQLTIGGSSSLSIMATSVLTLLGAGSAAGSLALARRADDRELLDAGADVADIGLTEAERTELLGK